MTFGQALSLLLLISPWWRLVSTVAWQTSFRSKSKRQRGAIVLTCYIRVLCKGASPSVSRHHWALLNRMDVCSLAVIVPTTLCGRGYQTNRSSCVKVALASSSSPGLAAAQTRTEWQCMTSWYSWREASQRQESKAALSQNLQGAFDRTTEA